ncbi:MAG: GNAT family N-acetyltransferase [Thermomicrobiales bacterium]
MSTSRTDLGAQTLTILPSTLSGRIVRLEPLELHHADALVEAARDAEIWAYMPVRLDDPDAMRSWIETALQERAAGTTLAYAIVSQERDVPIGATRFMDIRARDRGLEIGWTWLAKSAWRTGVNTEAKFLLLEHAFDAVGAIRVQFKTHRMNFRSRRAIERVGAQFEGILRNHYVLPDGTYRDSAYYSIIESEWPAVRRHLALSIERGGAAHR